MHEKQRQILDIIKNKGSATVNELKDQLNITGVTVRHHLDRLRTQGVVSDPQVRRRKSPGRPEYQYVLTPMATDHFPKGYDTFALHLLDEIKSRFRSRQVDAIFEGVSRRIVASVPERDPDASHRTQVDNAVEFLNSQGYVARREQCYNGQVLHICNCPYEDLRQANPELCQMDLNLVTSMLETEPECIGVMAQGADTCSYLIRAQDNV